MSISLVKGQKIDLTKGNAGLKKVVFALGWDTNQTEISSSMATWRIVQRAWCIWVITVPEKVKVMMR